MRKYRIEVNGRVYDVKVEEVSGGGVETAAPSVKPPAAIPTLKLEPPKIEVKPVPKVEKVEEKAAPAKTDGGILSPMQGTVVQVRVKVGDVVKKGDVIAIVEAMKMENDVRSHRAGVVKAVHIIVGQTVSPSTLLAVVE